jgi:serine/threonine protein kinase
LLAETEGESLVDTMSTANAVTSGLDCASPESIMDPTNLTPPGDQYSLGCTLYFLLTGQYPFPDGNAADKMMAHQFKQPKPVQELNPDVPAKLIEIIERLMQKAPEQRYHGTTEVVDALRPLATKEGLPRPLVTRGSANGLSKPAPQAQAQPQAVPTKSSPGFGGRAKPSAPLPPSKSPDKAPARPVTVAPSSPTPRPQSLGGLPTRDSVRGSNRPATMMAPSAAPSRLPTALPEPPSSHHDEPRSHHDEPRSHHDEPRSRHDEKSRVIPGDYSAQAEQETWDDRLGPVGVALAAGVACAAVYFLTVILRIF